MSKIIIRPIVPHFISVQRCNAIVVQVPGAPAQTNEIQPESNIDEGTGQQVSQDVGIKVADTKVSHWCCWVAVTLTVAGHEFHRLSPRFSCREKSQDQAMRRKLR